MSTFFVPKKGLFEPYALKTEYFDTKLNTLNNYHF